MCGRFALRNPEPVKAFFDIDDLEGNYNIAPGSQILSISEGPHLLKWGYTPYWADEPFELINARAETLWKKPSFRNSSRCLIPADGWYEWKKEGDKKVPYFFHHSTDDFFCFAAVYGGYRGVVGCAIVTTEANKELASIHNRMPAILDKSLYQDWIKGSEDVFEETISKQIEFYEVSTYVNNPSNNDEPCTQPV